MDISSIKSIDDLPRDFDILLPAFWSLVLDYRKLSDDYKLLKKDNFGRKSEKKIVADDSQLEMEGLFEQLPAIIETTRDKFVEVKTFKRRKNNTGRNAIPDDIATKEHIHDITQEEKNAAQESGNPLVKIGEERRTIIEREPAKYVKHVHVKYVYASQKKDRIVTADAPLVTPIPRILAGLNLLLFVILSKYQYHLPLYRIQRQIYHESRIWFTRATMVGWIAEICVPLRRIYAAMIDILKQSECIHSDDSRVKRAAHTSYMWVYVNGSHDTVIFDYRESRGAVAPREFLKGTKPGAYLMTDCCPSYNDAVSRYKLIQMACMMHVRREFIEAAEVGSQEAFASRIIRYIGQLYRIERYANAKKCTIAEKLSLREKYSREITDKIKTALTEPGITILPQSKIGKAINYTLGHWEKIIRFLDRGDLPIDNGIDERIIRDLAIGRKNWMFVQSDEGGRRMAILYSIIATCKLNNINPEEYFSDVLMRMAMRKDDAAVNDLTPIEWYKARNGGKIPENKPLYPSRS